MAKVVFADFISSVSGKFCKSDPTGAIFQRRKTCNVVCHIHNPYTGPATDKQVAVQTKFKTAWEAVAEVMNDPAQLAAATAEWKKDPGKYSTLRGYIFAQQYANL